MSVLGKSSRQIAVLLALLLAMVGVLAMAGTAAAAPGGISAAAAACEDGGFAAYTRADGTSFNNAGQCVNYAARGGELVQAVSLTIVLTQTSSTGGIVELQGVGLLPGSAVTTDAWYPNGTSLLGVHRGDVEPDGTFYTTLPFSCNHFETAGVNGTAADGTPVSHTAPSPC